MKEFINKLIERLEEESNNAEAEMHILADSEYSLPCQFDRIDIEDCKSKTFCEAIQIVNELAEEYKDGWISAKEPPKVFMLSDGNYIPFLVFDNVIWHPYIAFYDGKKWFRSTYYNIEPIFWQNLPSRPYTEGE